MGLKAPFPLLLFFGTVRSSLLTRDTVPRTAIPVRFRRYSGCLLLPRTAIFYFAGLSGEIQCVSLYLELKNHTAKIALFLTSLDVCCIFFEKSY